MASPKKQTPSIRSQKRALKKLVLSTPIEDLLPNKNKKAVEVLKRAGLIQGPPL